MSERAETSLITVVGGTGFVGSAVARALLVEGARVRVTARHPRPGDVPISHPRLTTARADVTDDSIVEALEGSTAVVNTVGLYAERGGQTFRAVHVERAARLARHAARLGISRLIHVSGIGASSVSRSAYVRARAEAEDRVRDGFADASVVRPAVLFGPGDAFLGSIDAFTHYAPIFLLFGGGHRRLQPVHVDDVAGAIARLATACAPAGRTFELGGPRIYTYREIVEAVLAYRGRRRLLIPVPFAAWELAARLLGVLPAPPVTIDQVILMESDNVVADERAIETLADLGVCPRSLERMLPACLP
jgi:uncharacterized protein YbjT (DUF2867 family)